jgi:hypothetical protein
VAVCAAVTEDPTPDAPVVSAVVIRSLRAEDVERFFEQAELATGAEWLARQERGELYVAVAEVDGQPVGHRCLDFAALS